MRVISYSELRNCISQNPDMVNEDKETVIVSRTQGKNVVVMDIDEYNTIQETLYLIGTTANRKRLENAITEMYKVKSAKHNIVTGRKH